MLDGIEMSDCCKESVIEGSSGVEMIHGVRKKEMYREQKVREARG